VLTRSTREVVDFADMEEVGRERIQHPPRLLRKRAARLHFPTRRLYELDGLRVDQVVEDIKVVRRTLLLLLPIVVRSIHVQAEFDIRNIAVKLTECTLGLIESSSGLLAFVAFAKEVGSHPFVARSYRLLDLSSTHSIACTGSLVRL
jgi:hypothetical protein